MDQFRSPISGPSHSAAPCTGSVQQTEKSPLTLRKWSLLRASVINLVSFRDPIGCPTITQVPGARSSHELFIASLPPAELSKSELTSHMKMQ
jgi:hypothetical protein